MISLYYQSLQNSTDATDSAPFIEFMLEMIFNAMSSVAPKSPPQATPQVENLLANLTGEMSRAQLQHAVGLKDRKSFRESYIAPALAPGLVEMKLPDKPNSPLQKYRLIEKGRQWLWVRDGK